VNDEIPVLLHFLGMRSLVMDFVASSCGARWLSDELKQDADTIDPTHVLKVKAEYRNKRAVSGVTFFSHIGVGSGSGFGVALGTSALALAAGAAPAPTASLGLSGSVM
jgi:hypothetical protein